MAEPVEPDRLADRGDATVGPLNGEVGRRLADQLVALIRQQPGIQTICDLGCGNGYLAGRLAALGYRVVGVDASRPYIDTANRCEASPNVSFVCAPFSSDSTPSLAAAGPFDLAVSSDVIEHLYYPSDLPATAGAILRPGGLFVVCTPYYGYWKNLAISLMNLWDRHHGVHWDGGHIKLFSVRTLTALVVRHGFEVVRFQYYGRLPWFWKNMICVARKAR